MAKPPRTGDEGEVFYPIFRVPNEHWVGSGRVTLRHVSPMPGSQAGLLPPSPLRTARESFPSSSSSLANALMRTRFHHGASVAMDLCMAVWVEEHLVLGTVRATVGTPHDMMAMPACQVCDGLMPHSTEP